VVAGFGRFLAFACAAYFGLGVAQAQQNSSKKEQASDACFDRFQVAHDTTGNPIVLSTKQLDERATKRVMPKYPPLLRQANFETHGKLKLLIDVSGAVSCATPLSGHPLVLPSALEAIKQWRFQPYVVDGQRRAVLGIFDFCFSLSGCPFVDLQQKPN
jgi:outer membrane biosynthesis protein TonB